MGFGVVSCSTEKAPSISILPSTENFSQGESFNLKLDILWVVDPSRSMFEEGERVKANISSFMKDIVESGYEYRMGVVSTAAWSDLAYQNDSTKNFLVYGGQSVFNRLHKGECTNHSAAQSANSYLSYLSESNLNLFLSRFNTYFDMYGAKINTSGCGLVGPPFGNYDSVAGNFFEDGRFTSTERSNVWQYANDERPLQSMKAYLSSSAASSFLRSEAYLAVILITDEPDGSRDDLNPSQAFDQSSGQGHTSSTYISFLDQLKGSREKYGVYSIIKQDGSNLLDKNTALESGGAVVNIDGSSADYKRDLQSIKDSILKEASLYPVSAEDPVPDSFVVKFIKKDGSVISVPKDQGAGGFKYLAGVNSLQFNSPYVPAKGDSIEVYYDKYSLSGGAGASTPFISLDTNKISESAPNGSLVGKLSVKNTELQGITFSLVSDTSDPDDEGPLKGAFEVSSSGEIRLIDSTKVDREIQALHSLRVSANSAELGSIERDLTIILEDAVDSLPVANNDFYTRSEKIVDASGWIEVLGNLSYNDSGIDSSEAHTYTFLTQPQKGEVTVNSDGSFSYKVQQFTLALSSGQSHVENLSYRLQDNSGNQSTATLQITILGANEAPILNQAIADQNVNIVGGEQQISLDSSTIVASGFSSGVKENLVDGSAATSASTQAASGAHYIELPLAGTSFFEVSRLEVDGAHGMGNVVFQVLSDGGSVLSREVLEIDQSSTIGVNFTTPAIGKKIKIIRPLGSVNGNGDQNIQIKEFRVFGYESSLLTIDLNPYFNDPDGDPLNFVVTDKYGEGPAPGWVSVSGSLLSARPPAGADVTVGVLAADTSGDSVFTTFRIVRTGGASNINAAPIALLDIDDTQRGGLSLERWGGDDHFTQSSDIIRWDEADDFLDQLLDEEGVLIPWVQGDFDHWGASDGHGTNEDGWNRTPSTVLNKYARQGRMIPYVEPGGDDLNLGERSYGEFYSGYFVPARTGYYRFRTTSLDDVVRLLLSPSEYFSDLEKVISGTIDTPNMRKVMADTVRDQGSSVGVLANYDLGNDTITNCRGTIFFPNSCGGPYDTSRFFIGSVPGYEHGLVYLTKGNAYAIQIRFMEGGGARKFDFEYDYRETATSSWFGWKPIDASIVIPAKGTDAYSSRKIAATAAVNFDASQIFYDAEQDILEYSAKLVLPDGSDFIGPGNTSDVSEVGLTFNIVSGQLSGSLNTVYDQAGVKPRVQFKAKEKFSSTLKEVKSLAIKFDK